MNHDVPTTNAGPTRGRRTARAQYVRLARSTDQPRRFRCGRLVHAVDIDLVRGAREGVGAATLLIDAGCVWDARTALRRAHAFKEFGIEWLEEPLREADVDGYVWLRDRSPVPIAAGEGECGRESFRQLVDRHALDVYQVDLSRNGFTDASYIRSRDEEIGARLCNHFTLHLLPPPPAFTGLVPAKTRFCLKTVSKIHRFAMNSRKNQCKRKTAGLKCLTSRAWE